MIALPLVAFPRRARAAPLSLPLTTPTMRRIRVSLAVLAVLATGACSSAHAQGPDTDIWIAPVQSNSGQLTIGTPVNATRSPGYDNHPWFLPDGRAIYFVSGRDGRQFDIYRLDIGTGTTTRLTSLAENEYSPKPAGAAAFTALREEPNLGTRLWRYALDGTPQGLAAHADHLGYYAYVDDRTIAFYVNEAARGFLVEDLRTHAITRAGQGIRGQPVPVAGKRAVTVLHDDSAGVTWLERYDLDAKSFTRLVRARPNTQWHSAAPDGSLLQTTGNTIWAFAPGRDTAWRAIAQFADPELQAIARIAFSPAGDRAAIVSAPGDAQAIRNARALSNRAIAAHDTAAFGAFMRPEIQLTRGAGVQERGRDAYLASLAASWSADSTLVYERTPQQVQVASDRARASEQGIWVGTRRSAAGVTTVRGTYMAHWLREQGGWTILSEVFVQLSCEGPGCQN